MTRPEPPIPATARPTINILDELAAPHSAEPNSKNVRKVRKVYFKTRWVYNLPPRGWRAQLIAVLVAGPTVQQQGEGHGRHTSLGDTHCHTSPHH